MCIQAKMKVRRNSDLNGKKNICFIFLNVHVKDMQLRDIA